MRFVCEMRDQAERAAWQGEEVFRALQDGEEQESIEIAKRIGVSEKRGAGVLDRIMSEWAEGQGAGADGYRLRKRRFGRTLFWRLIKREGGAR